MLWQFIKLKPCFTRRLPYINHKDKSNQHSRKLPPWNSPYLTSTIVKWTFLTIRKTDLISPEITGTTIWCCRMQQRGSYLLWICVGLGISLLLHSTISVKDSGGVERARKLLEDSASTSDVNWIEKGKVVLYFIGICFMFRGISIICDDFFVCAQVLSLCVQNAVFHPDATFMALGSSAPELFTSLIALADSRISNEIELGTIIGATAFNIFAIVGVSVLFSGRKINLDYRPLRRDCPFYLLAMAGVMVVFYDGKIYWWEGLIFVVFYGVYILVLKFNKKMMDMLRCPFTIRERFNANGVDIESLPREHINTSTSDEDVRFCAGNDLELRELKTYCERGINSNVAPLVPSTNGETSNMNATNHEQDNQTGTTNTTNHASDDQGVEDRKSPFIVPESKRERLLWFLSLPWNISFYYTVPDCSKPNSKKRCIATFMGSLLWIVGISALMVEFAERLDTILGIPGDFMGETILAAGISLRSALRSIKAARAGKADLDVANAIGSNIFDIWLGLGLPWLLVIPFIGENGSCGKFIEVDNSELLPSVAILFGVLVFYILSVICSRWTLDKRHGALFIAFYVVYVSYNIIVVWEFDVYR